MVQIYQPAHEKRKSANHAHRFYCGRNSAAIFSRLVEWVERVVLVAEEVSGAGRSGIS